MTMVEIIELKKNNHVLTKEQIHFIINGYCNNKIPDYQMSAFLMTICFNGLSKQEIFLLTDEMINSGKIMDLSKIKGIKVDKHSTGGVGDKTTLVVGPLVAACNVPVAKMSGRGLGHTGGTLDKLEAIPGFDIHLDESNFIKQVNEIRLAIIGQSKELALADQKIYALRDVTATVDCMPLIASSIMSKKIASGSDAILLDVKYGNGAFMKSIDEAEKLAQTMIEIGKYFNKDTRAIISNMDQPLGNTIGNSLEVIEAINTLKGKGPKDLLELCLKTASLMLLQAKRCKDEVEAMALLKKVLESGKALNKFKEMVSYQHGDIRYIDNPGLFKLAKNIIPVKAKTNGYVKKLDAKALGIISMKLGGGRLTKDDIIDHSVGIVLNKKIGDKCYSNDVLAYLYVNKEIEETLIDEVYNAYQIV
ncbi:pyrimidine-nucleoside phosphorylase [Thomasclavelia spiroformis]|uniref:pyrimidine-nucleoside phosphorylase n=2 Tax=Thomasclavelia spiroformis TaxID=29348 RepID=UPI00241DC3BD|nr:pyrimidine-nucleoside phosphorylase [Thomasclavelia spiroformis]MBS6116150.1 pyrimidine-nucleoside phosphorylase [Thomasclavelia spiroformis]MEE0442172.1 pyrimidine-nucleoside phosphorylase [Thomasclavelia sp.]